MLGSFNNSVGNNGLGNLPARSPSRAGRDSKKKQEQAFNQLLEREWSELPYAMMRISAARRPWDNHRVYWRDRNVQLGEIDLNLTRSRTSNGTSPYTATYAHEELRRDFSLQPSLEDDQILWTVPGISDVTLTTDQLAEKLLSKLVTFYTTGLSAPVTSSASPDLSS